jgi:hypothetical protein
MDVSSYFSGIHLRLRISIPLLALQERLRESLGVDFLPCSKIWVSCLCRLPFKCLGLAYQGCCVCGLAAIDVS